MSKNIETIENILEDYPTDADLYDDDKIHTMIDEIINSPKILYESQIEWVEKIKDSELSKGFSIRQKEVVIDIFIKFKKVEHYKAKKGYVLLNGEKQKEKNF